MTLGLFPELDEDALYFSRSNPDENLGTFAPYGFELENQYWPTVEHYYQAMKFENEAAREQVREAQSPQQARKRGRNRFKRIRKDWKSVKATVMTRGIYIRAKTHPELADQLLGTERRKLVENSTYDFFWGCGRDRRGQNQYGKVLMNVRDKLRSEAGS